MKIIFLGPPGAGKGSCAQVLSKKVEIPHISTGDIFRGLEKKGDPLIRRLQAEYSHKGKYIPDEEVLPIVLNRLAESDCSNGYILDGYPRTLPQAEALDREGVCINYIINLEVSEKALIERLSNRRTCRGCNTVYNLLTAKPLKEGSCDKCEGELYLRNDDKPEIVSKRFEVYNRQTFPLIEFYGRKGILHNVNADRPLEQVIIDVERVVGDYSPPYSKSFV